MYALGFGMGSDNAQDLGQALFREAGDALFLFAQDDGQLLDINPIAEHMTGLQRDELLKMRTTDLFRSEVDENLRGLGNAQQQSGIVHGQDGFLLRTRDDKVWIPCNLTIIQLHLKSKTLGLISARNVRAQREAYMKLQKVEAELRRILVSVSDCLWSARIDATGKWIYRYLSPVVEQIAGQPPEVFMGGPERWRAIVHPDDCARWEKSLVRLQSGIPAQEEEYRVVWPDGACHWVRDSVRVSTSPGDSRSLLLNGVLTDITARKQAEVKLLRPTQTVQ